MSLKERQTMKQEKMCMKAAMKKSSENKSYDGIVIHVTWAWWFMAKGLWEDLGRGALSLSGRTRIRWS